MDYKIIAKYPIEGKSPEVSRVSAEIDGIIYNKITPKIILNKNIFGEKSDIKYKTKDYILPGINIIDIDWNGAMIGDKEIDSTSQLLSLIANMYLQFQTQNTNSSDLSYLWEDVVYIDEKYIIYYEDENNNKLFNYTALDIYKTSIYTISPYTAHHIGIYDENGKKLYVLPLTSKYIDLSHTFNCDRYRVGLMSDVHHDDTCNINDHEEGHINNGNEFNPYEDLDHVLSFYENTPVEFICCAGDISTDDINHVKAFSEHVENICKDLPVYTCKGNHDNAASAHHDGEIGNNELWKEYTIPKNSKYNINYFTSGDQTSFYFIKDTDVYIFFNVDYNNTVASGDKPLTSSDYNYPNIEQSLRCYHPDTIKELQQILDTYRNQRCFVFTHQPFVNKAGNVGYSYSNRGPSYILSGIQFAILNEMNNYYKNSIWFSGHTHYQWKWQKLSQRANICNWDCLNDDYNYNDFSDFGQNINGKYSENYDESFKKSAFCVHIPSLSRPLRPESEFPSLDYNNLIADPGCEGAIMDVYSEGVNIRGIQFADENTKVDRKYNIIGEKRIITASDIIIDSFTDGFTENSQSITQLEDGYVQLTFGMRNQYTYSTLQRYSILNCIGNYIDIEDIQIECNGINITDILKYLNNPQIGFVTDTDEHLLTSGFCKVSGENNSITFELSNKFLDYNISDISLPLTLKFKAYSTASVELNSNSINYEDLYVSDANYWIPIKQIPVDIIESKTYEYFESFSQNFNK